MRKKERKAFALRMSATEKARFAKAAKAAGMSINAYILRCAAHGLEVMRAKLGLPTGGDRV